MPLFTRYLPPRQDLLRDCVRLLAVLALAAGATADAAAPCAADHTDRQVHVRYVLDGDTVILDDQQRLRFIGINTPELGHNKRPDEPLAAQARATLIKLLQAQGNRLDLRDDAEHRDHYGRQLSHPFLPDGQNLTGVLLDRGLATLSAHPPNTWNLDCLATRARQARAAQRGLWSLPAYQPQADGSLARNTRGYQIVRGHVSSVSWHDKGVNITLADRLHLWIARDDLGHFTTAPATAWIGRTLEVRGWIYRRHGKLTMKLRHPLALELDLPA